MVIGAQKLSWNPQESQISDLLSLLPLGYCKYIIVCSLSVVTITFLCSLGEGVDVFGMRRGRNLSWNPRSLLFLYLQGGANLIYL